MRKRDRYFGGEPRAGNFASRRGYFFKVRTVASKIFYKNRPNYCEIFGWLPYSIFFGIF